MTNNPEEKKKVQYLKCSEIFSPQIEMRYETSEEKDLELQRSISTYGLIHPVSVVKREVGYEIVAGHRRLKAHRALNIEKIPAFVENWDDETVLILRFHENKQRENISEYDEAFYIINILENTKKTQAQLAKELGLSTAYISQRVAITKYPDVLQEELKRGGVLFSVARELSRIKNNYDLNRFLDVCVKGKQPPNLVKQWVDELLKPDSSFESHDTPDSPPSEAFNFQSNEILMKCASCGESHEVSKMKNLWVCESCLKDE